MDGLDEIESIAINFAVRNRKQAEPIDLSAPKQTVFVAASVCASRGSRTHRSVGSGLLRPWEIARNVRRFRSERMSACSRNYRYIELFCDRSSSIRPGSTVRVFFPFLPFSAWQSLGAPPVGALGSQGGKVVKKKKKKKSRGRLCKVPVQMRYFEEYYGRQKHPLHTSPRQCACSYLVPPHPCKKAYVQWLRVRVIA